MNPTQKAKQLTEKFKDFVNPYTGSGMLSNTHDDSAILFQSKKCALVAVDEIIGQWEYIDTYIADGQGELNPNLKYWHKVKSEIEKL